MAKLLVVFGRVWLLSLVPGAGLALAAQVGPGVAAVLADADRLLDEAQVSYVYGGSQLGDPPACDACNACLTDRHPQPTQRLAKCPACRACSLDCSHFTARVFADAGFPYPYLDTEGMLTYSAAKLERAFHLVDLGTDLSRAQAGDLLVYTGHVVLLERLADGPAAGGVRRGDIIHATGGKDIRRPGEGIQRERFVDLAGFRGPLRRILRHASLAQTVHPVAERAPVAQPAAVSAPSQAPSQAPAPDLHRLRPVAKRTGGG
jgi:hypothetical protein